MEAGYITDDKLDEILSYQSNTFMKFMQSLLDKEMLSLDQINPCLNELQQLGGYSDTVMNALIHDDLEQCVDAFVPLKSKRLKEYILTFVHLSLHKLYLYSNIHLFTKNYKELFEFLLKTVTIQPWISCYKH